MHVHMHMRRYILEILIRAALAEARNVLVQGSLRDSAWHADYFRGLRGMYSDVRIAIIHVRMYCVDVSCTWDPMHTRIP